MKRIGFATSHEYPEGIDDDQRAAEALRQRGLSVFPLVWDRPLADQPAPDAVVIRSCWNYHLHPEPFLVWLAALERRGTDLLNSRSMLEWNYDKRYLKDLAARGLALPHTIWLERGAQADLETLLVEHELDQVVIKPAISLSAFQTWRTSRAAARSHQPAFAALLAQRSLLVQAFMPEVLTAGEVSLIFFGDSYSHAVRKRPRPGDFRVQADFGGTREPYTPSHQLIEQAAAVLRCVVEPLLYARVDGLLAGDQLVLMELELIDPVLFFAYDAAAADRFAEALLQRLAQRR